MRDLVVLVVALLAEKVLPEVMQLLLLEAVEVVVVVLLLSQVMMEARVVLVS